MISNSWSALLRHHYSSLKLLNDLFYTYYKGRMSGCYSGVSQVEQPSPFLLWKQWLSDSSDWQQWLSINYCLISLVKMVLNSQTISVIMSLLKRFHTSPNNNVTLPCLLTVLNTSLTEILLGLKAWLAAAINTLAGNSAILKQNKKRIINYVSFVLL